MLRVRNGRTCVRCHPYAFEYIKEENERLLTQIKEKENLILKMQMQLLETGTGYKRKKKK